MQDHNEEAIKILRRFGYIVSDRGILKIVDDSNESSVTLYPWKRIKKIETYKIGVNNKLITIHLEGNRLCIDLKNKDDALTVYKFLADKHITYGMGSIPK